MQTNTPRISAFEAGSLNVHAPVIRLPQPGNERNCRRVLCAAVATGWRAREAREGASELLRLFCSALVPESASADALQPQLLCSGGTAVNVGLSPPSRRAATALRFGREAAVKQVLPARSLSPVSWTSSCAAPAR